MKKTLGFTLIEMMIVIGILSLLATAGLPIYRKAIEQSYWRSSSDILQTIYAGEQVYWSAESTYLDPETCTPAWQCIYMDNPNGSNMPVTFKVTGVGPNTFKATATRNGGPCNNKTQTLDENRTAGGNWPSTGAC